MKSLEVTGRTLEIKTVPSLGIMALKKQSLCIII